MKALVSRSYGPIAQLELTELPTPDVGAGQVLVRVAAVALNPLDVKIITGAVREFMPVQHPFVPGLDVAGTVEAIGAGVTGYAVGDEVVAFAPPPAAGGVAEHVVVTAGGCLAHRAPGLSAIAGAGLPTGGMTATALLAAARPAPGQTVLIIGAAGGVGTFTVQLAARAGVRVLATAQPADADLLRELGAAEVIDYTGGDTVEQVLQRRPGGVDVVIDLVAAGEELASGAAALRPGGRLVSSVGGPERLAGGITPHYIEVRPVDGLLQGLVDRAAAGELRVAIGAVHPFGAAVAAVESFAGTHTPGKVVIEF